MIPYLDLRTQYRSIKDEIDAAVLRVLDSTQYILGEEVTAFEREFAVYTGAPDCVAVNSGTSALHLGLVRAGVGGRACARIADLVQRIGKATEIVDRVRCGRSGQRRAGVHEMRRRHHDGAVA